MSYPNLRAIIETGVSFVAPASKTHVCSDVLAACDFDSAAVVDYVAQRDVNKSPEERGYYRVLEDTLVITGKKKAEPSLELRRVFVWSSASDGDWEVDTTRPTQVTERIAVIARERHVRAYLRTTVGTDQLMTKPTLKREFDEAAQAAEVCSDGWTHCSPTSIRSWCGRSSPQL